uniref:Putative molecular chaperone dnaj superfamily n=1 Tax=Xenopsylla cheopis TaxID=163159 RepID=A0A6M2DIU2_XENCH
MDEDTEDNSFEENYYSFLNIPRTATPEEINSAYRNFSRLFHPDKHQDAVQKENAEIMFNRTKQAYEVLSNPHKRAIYDSLGIKGLQTDGWEIVSRTRTPAEIREEYERLARERAERRLQQRTNPRGNVTLNVNATELFTTYVDEYELDDIDKGFPTIEVSGMNISQSIEAPLTLRDTITMSGSIGTQNGTGSGRVNISGRRLLSERGWIELDIGAGSGPSMGFKGFRTLSKRVFCNFVSVLQFTPRGIRPEFVSTLAMQLDKHTVGYLTHRYGTQSSMSTMVVRDTEGGHYNFTLQAGLPHSFISIAYTKKMLERELKLKIAIKIGTFGALFEYGAEKKVSQHSSLSATMSVGVPTGVTLKIKLVRASQTYLFPIHLCEEVIPSPIFYGTVVPLLGWMLLKRFIVEPMQQEQKDREMEKAREANKTRLMEQRREAMAAIDLMTATYARIRSEEEAKGGLVIIKAIYGIIMSTKPNHQFNDTEVLDVTVPVQCMVKDSKLSLHEATKSQLPGFCDTCLGENKMLHIQYSFRGNMHEVTIQDNEVLRIPKPAHRVTTT